MLEGLYQSDIDAGTKRARKKEILDALSAETRGLIDASGSDADNWLAAPLNNARLASLGLYEGGQEAFRKILGSCDGKLPCFYAEAQKLAELDQDERTQRLEQMAD